MSISKCFCVHVYHPETGGIIGSRDGIWIDHVVFDRGKQSENGGTTYQPDVQYLNTVIREWESNGIEFRGIFHTHAEQWPDLSSEDKLYMKKILGVMPDKRKGIYCPLVFPDQHIKVYLVKQENGVYCIIREEIEIGE